MAPFFFDCHVALGCASGAIRFASLVDRSGAPMAGPGGAGVRQAHALRLALHSGVCGRLKYSGHPVTQEGCLLGQIRLISAINIPFFFMPSFFDSAPGLWGDL